MAALWTLFAYLTIYIWRVVAGPSIWDRLLGLNLISAKLLLIIVVFASVSGMSFLLDIAIVGALLGFISTVFISLFILKRLTGGKR